jgi:hypothetical protein
MNADRDAFALGGTKDGEAEDEFAVGGDAEVRMLAEQPDDPILILERERLAAWKRWGPAQRAAELIEWSLPGEILRPGVLMGYRDERKGGHVYYEPKDAEAAKASGAKPIYARDLDEFRRHEAIWGVYLPGDPARAAQAASRDQTFWAELHAAEAARDKAFDDSGYTAAKAIEDKLEVAAAAIELKMAETVPATLAGLRIMADLADNRWGSTDGRDADMLDRIIEALEAMVISPMKAILLAFAERAKADYDDEFIAPPMLRAMVVAIDAIEDRVTPAPVAATEAQLAAVELRANEIRALCAAAAVQGGIVVEQPDGTFGVYRQE